MVTGNKIEVDSTHKIKENLLLLRDSLELWRIKSALFTLVAISKNGYIDQLDDVIDKYSNTYRRTIKMKSIDVKTSAYVTFNIENNGKYPKFKIGDHVK